MDKPKYAIAESPFISSAKFDMTDYCDISCEYTMPDYYPPIRKIVSCTADALPDTKFISGSTLEYGGTTSFSVMYIGEDGALVCLPYATEYSSSLSLPAEVHGTSEIAIDARAEDIQCRVLAPRKLSLKAKVRARISADNKLPYVMNMLDCDGDAVSASERALIQSLSCKVPVMSGARVFSTGRITGEIREKPGAKPVSCVGAVSITEAKSRRDSVFIKGEVRAKCMVFTHDGYYTPSKVRIPFEETLPADGAMEGDFCRAWGRVASITVSEIEDGNLKADIEYDLEAEWRRKSQVSLVLDAYAAGRDSQTERDDINCHSLLCCLHSSLSVNGNGKRTTKPQPNEYLMDMTCEAAIDKAEQKNDHIIFTGSCRIKAYIVSNGEIICEEMTLPLKYEAASQSPDCDGRIIFFADAVCTDINGRLDGDTVYANSELCLSLYAKRECKISPVSRIKLSPSSEDMHCKPQIKVLYGTGDSILWDISKKYKVAAARLEEVNSLSRKDKINGKAVIIPIGIG